MLLIGNYPPDAQESMKRFATMMLSGLRDAGVNAELLLPPAVFGRLNKFGLGKWLGYLDKLLLFPWLLHWAKRQVKGPLIVHVCDHSNAFYTHGLQRTPHLVMCHDLLAVRSALGEFPGNRTGWSGRILQAMILRGLNRARHVACISEATRADVMRLTRLENSQISTIPVALNHPYSPMPAQETRIRLESIASRAGIPIEQITGGFLFHVGGNQWYKNRMGVLRIYLSMVKSAASAPALLMAGQAFTPEMNAFVLKHQLNDRVWALESCDNEDLRALYTTASALVFPSLAEGFGWPVIEAQACGCPVLCSDREPFPEVGGDGPIYRDPADEEGFAQAIFGLLADPEARQAQRSKGIANADRYRLKTMIAQYLDCYRRLLP